MYKGRRLYADTFCDVYTLLSSWIDDHFWDFDAFDPDPNSICVVGRKQTVEHTQKVRHLCEKNCLVVFANSAEGSSTQIAQLKALGLEDLVLQGRMLLLSGGRMDDRYPCLLHEHFLVRVLAFQENLDAMDRVDEIFCCNHKPFVFLFLNGRGRPHRKYLWHRFNLNGTLPKSLWTMMDGRGTGNHILKLYQGEQDLMAQPTPIRWLPAQYEVPRYRNNRPPNIDYPHQYVKFDIFNNQWGEIYLEPAPYIDTYFSLVTETILEYPHSFFTEKIAKPLAQGHPWIAAANQGFYRDLRALGFKTFNHVIDEGFDRIDNDQDRMDRIVDIVTDLCNQDLKSFLAACQDICKYNQQHLIDVVQQEKVSFPDRFFHFIDEHG